MTSRTPSAADVYAATKRVRRSDWSELVRRWARAQPSKVALRHGDDVRTYDQLDERADRVCNLLAAAGVAPGDTVAILSRNRLEVIDVYLGALRRGAITVPLNTRLSTNELAYQLHDSRAKVVFAETDLAESHRDALSATWTVYKFAVEPVENTQTSFEECLAGAPECEQHLVDASDPAFIIYTSGTTGRPKGAVLSQTNLLVRGFASLGLMGATSPDEVWFAGLPLFHVGGLASVLNYLLLGGSSVITDTGNFDPFEVLSQLRSMGATSAFFVPTQWDAICTAVDELPDEFADGLSLRRLVWGAAPASPATLEGMSRAFPGVATISSFGQTEMSGASCILRGDDALRKVGSVGRPLPGVAVRIVDDQMRDLPVGEVGEIVYQGPTVFLGYWDNLIATNEALVGGWFHSGDLCRMDEDGFVWVVDRKKDMIVSGGENIYSAEVESALSTHPQIADVAVIGMPHPRWGETPLAVVVPTPGSDLTQSEVIAHSLTQLASYKKPTRVEIVDELPRNAGGKVLKRVLRDRYAETSIEGANS